DERVTPQNGLYRTGTPEEGLRSDRTNTRCVSLTPLGYPKPEDPNPPAVRPETWRSSLAPMTSDGTASCAMVMGDGGSQGGVRSARAGRRATAALQHRPGAESPRRCRRCSQTRACRLS